MTKSQLEQTIKEYIKAKIEQGYTKEQLAKDPFLYKLKKQLDKLNYEN